MDILIATDVTVRGGVDRYVAALARHALAAGHRVTMAIEQGRANVPRFLLEAAPAVRRCRLYHRWYPPDELAGEACDLLNGVRPDLLHVAAGVPWSSLPLREAARELGIRQVVCEQSVPDELALDSGQASRIQDLYRVAHAVVFVSEYSVQLMRAHLDMKDVCVNVIPNGVDTAALGLGSIPIPVRLDRLRYRQQKGDVRILAAGRFDRQKGFDVLLDACSILRDRGRPYRLTLLGEGPARPQLMEQVTKNGLSASVALGPWQEDLAEAAAEHDAFVLPSRYEGMSYILLEMMARGIPVVATDLPSSAFALTVEHERRLVARDDPAALADALEEVVIGLPTVMPLVGPARERVAEHFDERKQMSATITCWPLAD